MPTHYINSESCKDYHIYVPGTSSATTKYIRFKDGAGTTAKTGDEIGLIAAREPGGAWVDDLSSAYYVYKYGPYSQNGAIEVGSPAANFTIVGDGTSDKYHYFKLDQAPATPDEPVFDYAIPVIDNAAPAPGDTVNVTIYLRDSYNRFKTVGGDSVVVTPASYADADLSISAVTDNGDGSYSFTITKPTAGYGYFVVSINSGTAASLNRQPSPNFTTSPFSFVDEGKSFISVTGDTVEATLIDQAGNPVTTDYTSSMRLFSPDVASFGPPAWDGANKYSWQVPAGSPQNIRLYCFYADDVLRGSCQMYAVNTPVTHIITPRQIALVQRVGGTITPRQVELSQNVVDFGSSMPSPGGGGGTAGAGWPKRMGFSV